ncbi:MAG: hypothetical protein ING44_12805 [Telmatospirillum sp.]|nr:hypothetical protein [Telmatospirillum sp.]
MLEQYAQKIARAVKDPALVLQWLDRRLSRKQQRRPKGKVNAVAASLAQRAAEIGVSGHRRMALFGDKASLAEAQKRMPTVEFVWLSSDYDDLRLGARNIHSLDPESVDAFLVAGGDVAANYRQTLRWMLGGQRVAPVYWVAAEFEFCGGTMPIASACTDADVLIFNHFAEFLGQKDPLLVRVETFDRKHKVERWFILRPNESIRVRVSDWLPKADGPVCVAHHCSHPRLTLGRHYRWRSTAVFHWNDSIAMAHSDTDFRRPDATTTTEHKIGLGTVSGGTAAITLPNYERALGHDRAKMAVLAYDRITEVERDLSVRLDETTLRIDGRATTYDDFFGAKFAGSGGSFWFVFDSGHAGREPSLSANHSVRGELVPVIKRPSTDEAAAFVAELARYDIMLDPHALPVEPAGSPVEFGFEFDMNFPVLKKFHVSAYGPGGKLVGAASFEKAAPGAIFADALLRDLGFEGKNVQMLMLSPDWIGAGADPRGRGAAGNLVVRLRATGDYDATEFQNSWRNLGFSVRSLPHWLSQDRMLAGRTNLMCGVAAERGGSVGISCINASGRRSYSEPAEVVVRVLAEDGRELEHRADLAPFSHRMIWLDEVVAGWQKHLRQGFGCVVVQSFDADINANVVVKSGDRAVALQHMWGY